MTPKRLFIALCALLFIMFVGLFAGTYEMTGLLKTKSGALASNKSTLNLLRSQQTGLARAKQQVKQYSTLNTIAKTIVPQDKDQAEAVRQITNIANANGVVLTSITFPSSTLGGTSSNVAPTAGVTAPSASATTKKNALSQLILVPAIPGVYNLQITIANNTANSVNFDQLDAFLAGLENNRRTAEVASIAIQPLRASPGQLTFTLVVNTYIKPS